MKFKIYFGVAVREDYDILNALILLGKSSVSLGKSGAAERTNHGSVSTATQMQDTAVLVRPW
jgi:hypothetical protein